MATLESSLCLSWSGLGVILTFRTRFKVVLLGVAGVTGASASEVISKQSKAHGAVNILGWGVLLPIGAMIARYARGYDPAWFYIHAVCQSLGFIFIIAGVGTGIVLSHKVTPQGFAAHRGIALFLFALAFLQVWVYSDCMHFISGFTEYFVRKF